MTYHVTHCRPSNGNIPQERIPITKTCHNWKEVEAYRDYLKKYYKQNNIDLQIKIKQT